MTERRRRREGKKAANGSGGRHSRKPRLRTTRRNAKIIGGTGTLCTWRVYQLGFAAWSCGRHLCDSRSSSGGRQQEAPAERRVAQGEQERALGRDRGGGMALTLYSLFKAALLVLNALAVLHPHRFLAKCAFPRGNAVEEPTRRCLALHPPPSPPPHPARRRPRQDSRWDRRARTARWLAACGALHEMCVRAGAGAVV